MWYEGDRPSAAPTNRKAEAQPSLAALPFLVEVRGKILPPYSAALCFRLQPYGSISHLLVLLEGCSRKIRNLFLNHSLNIHSLSIFYFLDIKFNIHDVSSPHVFVILHYISLHVLLKNSLPTIFLLTKAMPYSAFPLSVTLSMHNTSLIYHWWPNSDCILFIFLFPSRIAIFDPFKVC